MEQIIAKAVERLVRKGSMIVRMPSGIEHAFGDGTGARAGLHIKDRSVLRHMVLDPSLGLSEGYMDGLVEIIEGDLLDVFRIVFVNGDYAHMTGPPSVVRSGLARLGRLLRPNTADRSRLNVHHHYDLSEQLYRLFLDPDMQYSCGYFERPGEDLAAAQLAKKRHIAAKLCLEPGQSVLDIGCGWGGLAIYLARHGQAEVTGVTLSPEQLTVACGRAAEAGDEAQVRFELQDYRSVSRRFDRIVSVGMFEHVGKENFDRYFRTIARLLKEDGVALVHTIGRHGPPQPTDSFIARHVFPGGYIPSLSDVSSVIEEAGLVLTDLEVLRLHYAETLKAWRANFNAARDQIRALYDERFCRMWEFYLAGAEAAFRWSDLCVFQFQLARNKAAVPLTRAYVEDAEKRLKVREGAARRRQSRQTGIAAVLH